jgi:branched-chain amino acid transport system permease protein
MVGALLVALGACDRLDAEEVRVCRIALPALNPPGSAIVVLGARRGAEAGSVRIDYRVAQEGTSTDRFALCRFGPRRLRGRPELLGIATESGPLTGASVHLLRRHYIDTPEGAAADPGPPRSDDGRWRFRLW